MAQVCTFYWLKYKSTLTLAKLKFNTLNARPFTLRQVKAREELWCNARGTTIRYPESTEALVPWAKCPLPYPFKGPKGVILYNHSVTSPSLKNNWMSQYDMQLALLHSPCLIRETLVTGGARGISLHMQLKKSFPPGDLVRFPIRALETQWENFAL